MIENIGGVTSQLIGVALDAALLRHEVIANNIANVDTPGFQSRRLNFEAQLSGFIGDASAGGDALLAGRVDWLRSVMSDSGALLTVEGEPVQLDQQMIELTENTLRYQALIQAAGKRGELVSMAVKEGRR